VEWSVIIAMAVYSFVLAVTPGPNNTALLALGGRFGFRATLPYLAGMAVGLSVLVAVMALGLGSLLEVYPAGFLALKYVAFAFVLYLAWRTLGLGKARGSRGADNPITVWQSSVFQLVNPKAWIATGTLIAAYVPEGTVALGFVVAALTFVLATLPGAMIWAFAGQAVSFLLTGSRAHRIFSVVMALALIATMVPVLLIA
jgi:threonine/homoserine/homoserine lactone efflux protein